MARFTDKDTARTVWALGVCIALVVGAVILAIGWGTWKAITSDLRPAGLSMSISGEVPVICTATVQPHTLGDVLTGICNAPDGFTVVARYPASLAGSVLIAGNETILLNDMGASLVLTSDKPARIELPLSGPDGLTFHVTPN